MAQDSREAESASRLAPVACLRQNRLLRRFAIKPVRIEVMKLKILLTGLLVAAVTVAGQNPPPTFTSMTQLKVLYASVLDKHRNSVTSLKGENFKVFEDNVEQ